MTRVGSKNMFVFGMFATAVTAVLFGMLSFIYETLVYIVYSMVIRCLQGIAAAALMTSAFALITALFPKRVATMIGFLEVFGGLGLTLGPPFGGALYEVE
ncbi:unnamed protein product [Soboliphyme baturini]|uniref:MFS domain-containing protein n=1 Tax=Soboliphyme baturini TaxID=241478 RepID=A0A183J163_9BILA|nr:unnamed protein product [Soboliphyme baturini]